MAYVVFDTETTGLDPALGDRIIEIAAVRVHNGVMTEEVFDSLINPRRAISTEAKWINHIDPVELEKAPDSRVVIPQFLNFVGSDVLVAHNAEFDLEFLKAEMERLNLDTSLLSKAICTISLSKEQFPQLGKYTLEKLIEHLGISVDRRHRALDDARATAKLFLHVYHEEPTLF